MFLKITSELGKTKTEVTGGSSSGLSLCMCKTIPFQEIYIFLNQRPNESTVVSVQHTLVLLFQEYFLVSGFVDCKGLQYNRLLSLGRCRIGKYCLEKSAASGTIVFQLFL